MLGFTLNKELNLDDELKNTILNRLAQGTLDSPRNADIDYLVKALFPNDRHILMLSLYARVM